MPFHLHLRFLSLENRKNTRLPKNLLLRYSYLFFSVFIRVLLGPLYGVSVCLHLRVLRTIVLLGYISSDQ